ncbi:MAG: hypothetical protein BGO49_02965 [Planctomycetales bacterium 71-10]|nr:MAG: hypothetical protein BGO49_02965 [Planctomycetales bacterium 71-10]
MMNVHDACDYIIVKATEGGVGLNHLKLQKLAYYAQAWHLAFYDRPLFDAEFQAWIHGPVCRPIYDRFAVDDGKSIYSRIDETDVRDGFDPDSMPKDELDHIDGVLEVYAGFSGSQLEDMTHQEDPWIAARAGYRPTQRCEVVIDPELMRAYYAARVSCEQ